MSGRGLAWLFFGLGALMINTPYGQGLMVASLAISWLVD